MRILPWSRGSAAAADPEADARIVAGLSNREPWAAAALIERHGAHVRRVLFRVLGNDGELEDLAQEVFARAWKGLGRLSHGAALKGWLSNIAVFTARETIRRRGRRRRWLEFLGPPRTSETDCSWAGADLREAARCVYRIFDQMPPDERIPFALRLLDGMELDELAIACGMSLATVRRRLLRAERRFFKLARQCEALEPWMMREATP